MFEKKAENIRKVKFEKPENFLKNGLNIDDFIYGETIYESDNSKVVKVTHKKTSKVFAVKMVTLRLKYENKTKSKIIEKENRINTEVRFYEKFSNMLEEYIFYPEYHGYFKEVSMLGLTTYHIFFNFYQNNLRDIIKRKALSSDFLRIKRYFYQLIEILTFLQTCGIAHRDIKPENILLDDKEEKLLLTDFGIAVKTKEMVDNGKFSGTYFSPEWMKLQYKQKNDDIHEISGNFNLFMTDSFNLGLVVLEMAGIPLNFEVNSSFNEYIKDVQQKVGQFSNKFQKEIKLNEENIAFYEDLQAILQINPNERSDFIKIFISRWKFDNEDKLKYHIFVEDMKIEELGRFSIKKIQIIKEIYENLDQFLISMENPQHKENFTELMLKYKKLIEEMVFLNYPKAMLLQGIQMKLGNKFEKNFQVMQTLFEQSYKLEENSYCMLFLGMLFEETKEPEKSFRCYEKCASQKNVFGMYKLGHAYIKGIGCKPDTKKGFSLMDQYSKLADNIGSSYWKTVTNKRVGEIRFMKNQIIAIKDPINDVNHEKLSAKIKNPITIAIKNEELNDVKIKPSNEKETKNELKQEAEKKPAILNQDEKKTVDKKTSNQPKFQNDFLFSFESLSQQELIFVSKIAEQAEMFQDMKDCMKKFVSLSKSRMLSVEEGNLLSVAYKNELGQHRSSWRSFGTIEEKYPVHIPLLKEYKKKIEKVIIDSYTEIIFLLDQNLFSNNLAPSEQKIFFLKMKGDYYRFIAEVAFGDMYQNSVHKSGEAYKEAMDLAKSILTPCNPIRLGLALNYSVYFYEIANDKLQASNLAKNAFDVAIAGLDTISDSEYKDSTLIMQLLRDNLTLWTSDAEENNNENKEIEEKNEEKNIGNRLQTFSLSREELVFLTQVAEELNRYPDMFEFIKKVVTLNPKLSNDERNLLSVAFKNNSGFKRSAGRILASLENNESNEKNLFLLKEYKKKIDNELIAYCNEIIILIDQYILKNDQTEEDKVLFLKIKADAYRFIAEVSTGSSHINARDNSEKAYKEGANLAIISLKSTHPIRLSLFLNYSVLFFEVINDPTQACNLAKQAFDDAIDQINNLEENQYQDATNIMQLIRDNLTLWTSDIDNL